MYQIFPHTADVGIRIDANDIDELFVDGGRALFSLIVANLDDIEPRIDKRFVIHGDDLEFLLVDWLNELLFTFESEKLLLTEFEVSVDPGGLTATARGERVDSNRHGLEHEVKAITYHGLMVAKTDTGWAAEVIVDI